MVGAPRQADHLEQLIRAPAALADAGAGDAQGDLDVLVGAEQRQQAERLKDEADLVPPHRRQLPVVHRRDVFALELSRWWPVSDGRAHHRPYELSGGEQQRVAIARALANRPALILADEPTGELDSTTANQIFELLLQVVEQEGVTIITTTHDRLVMEKAARVLELADGALQTGPTYFERDRQQAVHIDMAFAAPPPTASRRPGARPR